MIAITRRVTNSKVHQQLVELLNNNRVQTTHGTSAILTPLQRTVNLAATVMDYKVLCKSPRFKVRHMCLVQVVRTQVQEMVPSIVRDAVGQTAPCSEQVRQMATARDAFWRAQFLSHTLIQFQVMYIELCTKSCSLEGPGHAILRNFSTDQMVIKLKYKNNASKL